MHENVQPALVEPLKKMENAGMKIEVVSRAIFPSGRHFFGQAHEQNFVKKYFPEAKMMHNNFIEEHDLKIKRFKEYQLWHAGDATFPECMQRQ